MAHIISLAQALPLHTILQDSFAAKVAKASRLDVIQTKWLERLYDQSGIETRYSVLEDFTKDPDQWDFWNKCSPSSKERNECYKQQAPLLSIKSCQLALDEWGEDPKSITHIIYVSCTGIVVPGIQAYLQEMLGLNTSVCQFGLNMMGCFGAFKGLQMAQSFCSQDSMNRVLVVCTELCSLHFQQKDSQEAHIGNALFADASAACIVAYEPKGSEKSYFHMKKHNSKIIPNTSETMTWDLSNNGLVFGVKKEVPHFIKEHIRSFAKNLLPENSTIQECLWPIHPGGKGILQAVEEALQIDLVHTAPSWYVLKHYGNISSASYLFVLNQLRQQKTDKKWAVGLGFGPGLCFEGMLLEIL